MQETLQRAHLQYVSTAALEADDDDTTTTARPPAARHAASYRALERTVKLEVQWPADEAQSPAPWREAEGSAPGTIGAAMASHIVEHHLSQCLEWARTVPGLAQHLAEHGAEVASTASHDRIQSERSPAEMSPAEIAAGQPAPAPQPVPAASKPQRERRYKCVSRAALTKRKEGPRFDEATGRPADGEILGFINAGELVSVLEDDMLLSPLGGPQRLFVEGRGGWVSLFAQDGTQLLAELEFRSSPAMSLGGSRVDVVSRDSSEYVDIGAAPLDRSSFDVHLDPLGLGDVQPLSSSSSSSTAEHSTPPLPESEPGGADSSADGEAGARLYASVSAGRYRAMFDFEPEQDTDLRLTRGGVVLLQNKAHEHWWEGANEADPSVVGMFPFNYVQPLMTVRASRQLPAGDEITVTLPPALCPLAEDGSTQEGLKLQVLLPHGADAGQEIEFPLPFDFDTSRIESESESNDGGSFVGAASTLASSVNGAGLRLGITKGGNQVPAGATPPFVDVKTRRRRELEAEKAMMYRKIEGELSKALSAADAKSLVRSKTFGSRGCRCSRFEVALVSTSLVLGSES